MQATDQFAARQLGAGARFFTDPEAPPPLRWSQADQKTWETLPPQSRDELLRARLTEKYADVGSDPGGVHPEEAVDLVPWRAQFYDHESGETRWQVRGFFFGHTDAAVLKVGVVARWWVPRRLFVAYGKRGGRIGRLFTVPLYASGWFLKMRGGKWIAEDFAAPNDLRVLGEWDTLGEARAAVGVPPSGRPAPVTLLEA